MTQPQWLSDLDLTRSDGRIQVYTDQRLIEQIKNQAEENGETASQYGARLLLEGLLSLSDGPSRIAHSSGDGESPEELERRIQELEDRLEQEKRSTEAGVFDENDLKARVLTDEFQNFEEIKHGVAESGLLDQALLSPLEDQLWKLVAQDEAEYTRGYGFKLAGNRGGQE